jgi:hypothetical protein
MPGEVEVEAVTDGQSASLSWCQAPIWNSWPDFSFLPDNFGFLDVEHPLWREDGSVICLYNCFWDLPEQSLWGQSPTELRPYFTVSFEDSPNLEGQVPIYTSPRNRVAKLYLPVTGFPFRPNAWLSGCPSLILCRLARGGPMEMGAAMLRADWLDGKSLEDWHSE